jgi:succinyl-CoA synthetase beta subunit
MISSMFAKQFLRNSMRQQPIMMTQYQRRFFDLHEFQSKYIMGKYGVNVQKGAIALNETDAAKIASGLSNKGGLILKAQVKAGGRGKGTLTSGLKGGVKICKTPEEIKNFTKQMIGYNLITHQTPPEGLLVKSVLVHEGVDIDKQLYLAILHDRKNQALCVVSSTKGGMDIEEVAKEDPDAIKIHSFDIRTGLTKESATKIVDSLELPSGKLRDQGIDQLQKLYQMFIKLDATQIEVNPWAITPEKDIYCVDAKINIDDNALFRQQELLDMYKQGANLTSAAD